MSRLYCRLPRPVKSDRLLGRRSFALTVDAEAVCIFRGHLNSPNVGTYRNVGHAATHGGILCCGHQ